MKNNLRHITLLLIVMFSLHCVAEESAPKDTIYFYDTWQQMLDDDPVEMLINPYMDFYSAYEVYFESANKRINQRIQTKHIAISMGDSVWLINSRYLNRAFTCSDDHFAGYIPVFFNEKAAYITYHANLSAKNIFFGIGIGENGEYLYDVDFFHIDFLNHRVSRVTPSYLSQLLEDYHDLQMRYEGMKDYKKRPIIEEFYLRYIDRVTNDIMRPYIVDLVSDQGMPNHL